MKITNLKINNFKGIKNLELKLSNENYIYGKNESCKSSISDAIHWLFFNKNAEGRESFDLKPAGTSKVETSVHAVINEHGTELKIGKSLTEVYERKTGTTSKLLTGHTCKYYLDDNKVRKKDFDIKLESMCSLDLLKILINPQVFASLAGSTQRDMLMEYIPVDELTAQLLLDPCYDQVKEKILEKGYLKELKKMKKKANEELKEIPVRIDELSRNIKGYTHEQLKENEAKLKELTIKLEKEKKKKAEATEDLSDKKRPLVLKISSLKKAKKKLLDNEEENYNKRIKALRVKLNERNKELIKIQEDKKLEESLIRNQESVNLLITKETENIKSNETDILQTTKAIEKYREEWHNIKALVFSKDENFRCSLCNQELPENAQKNEFELNKKNHLNTIKNKGKEASASLENLRNTKMKAEHRLGQSEKQIAVINKKLSLVTVNGSLVLEEVLKRKEEDIKEIHLEIDKTQLRSVDVSYLDSQIQENENELCSLTPSFEFDSKIIDEIAKVKVNIQDQKDEAKRAERIQELKDKIKSISNHEIEIEELIIKCEEFQIQKMKIIQDKLSELADNEIKFQTYRKLLNGGIEEHFEIISNDNVPWSSMSTSQRIKAGLSIIKLLSKKNNCNHFVIIDNKESITKIPRIENQIISMIVSEEDNNLRIESR